MATDANRRSWRTGWAPTFLVIVGLLAVVSALVSIGPKPIMPDALWWFVTVVALLVWAAAGLVALYSWWRLDKLNNPPKAGRQAEVGADGQVEVGAAAATAPFEPGGDYTLPIGRADSWNWRFRCLLSSGIIVLIPTCYALLRWGGTLLEASALVAGVVWITFVAVAYRRARLILKAHTSSAIAVQEVVDGTSSQQCNTKLATIQLRKELSHVDSYSDSAVPGGSSQHDLVTLVDAVATGDSLADRVLRFIKHLVPNHAYEVHATLLEREMSEAPVGVSVQLRVLPNWTSPPVHVWAPSQHEAVRKAASAATQILLPWAEQAEQPQWSRWQNTKMPESLLFHYQEGKRLADERRYDEALGEFMAALRLDPSNLSIRLDAAEICEKLSLYLDALEWYLSIRRLCDARPPNQDPTRGGHVASVRQLATYRASVALTRDDLLARQWLRGGTSARDLERAQLRDRLCVSLGELTYELCSKSAASSVPEGQFGSIEERDIAAESHALLAADVGSRYRAGDDNYRDSLQEFFLLCGALLAQQMEDEEEVLSPLTLKSLQLVVMWAKEHVAERYRNRFFGDSPSAASGQEAAILSRFRAIAHQKGLIPTRDRPVDLRTAEVVKTIAGDGEWLDHYNAACVLAHPLLTKGGTADHEEAPTHATRDLSTTAGMAVAQLRLATSKLDAATLRSLAPWVCSEDPDLRGLRGYSVFAGFAYDQFPGQVPDVPRPMNAHRFELRLHILQVIRRSARLFAAEWLRMTTEPPPRAVDLHALGRAELRCWRSVANMSRDWRHWQTRLRLMTEMHAWCRDHNLPAPAWNHPDYAVEAPRLWPAGPPGDGRVPLDVMIENSKEQLAVTSQVLNGSANSESAGFLAQLEEGWHQLLGGVVGTESLSEESWRRLGTMHWRAWAEVEMQFATQIAPDATRDQSLRKRLDGARASLRGAAGL